MFCCYVFLFGNGTVWISFFFLALFFIRAYVFCLVTSFFFSLLWLWTTVFTNGCFSCRRSWLVDSNRIATKIKSASSHSDSHQVVWNSNPTRHCPNCHHVIDNNDDVRFALSLVSLHIYDSHTKVLLHFPGSWCLARLATRCEIRSIWSWDHLAFACKIWFVGFKHPPFHWWVHPNC